VGVGLPLTDIVTERDCAEEIVIEAGVTVTVGVVLEGGGVLLPPPPPPQPATHRLPAIPSQNATCRPKLLMRALSLPALPLVCGRSVMWTQGTPVPVRSHSLLQIRAEAIVSRPKYGIEIIFSPLVAYVAEDECRQRSFEPRRSELCATAKVFLFDSAEVYGTTAHASGLRDRYQKRINRGREKPRGLLLNRLNCGFFLTNLFFVEYGVSLPNLIR
jgi:hypothetical protein